MYIFPVKIHVQKNRINNKIKKKRLCGYFVTLIIVCSSFKYNKTKKELNEKIKFDFLTHTTHIHIQHTAKATEENRPSLFEKKERHQYYEKILLVVVHIYNKI